MVHVLGFDDGLEVVLQDAGKVVLQLAAPEVRQNFLPVRQVLHQGTQHLNVRSGRSCSRQHAPECGVIKALWAYSIGSPARYTDQAVDVSDKALAAVLVRLASGKT